jgi:two-component system, NarL family, sensor histidine kinase DesK
MGGDGWGRCQRRLVAVGAIAVLGAVLVELLWAGEPWAHVVLIAVAAPLALVAVLFACAAARRSEALRLTRDEVERLARVNERERIGRDLHDLLGHTLSLIAIKSELAGKLLDRDAASAREQIGEVEAVARDALGQVRRAVAGIRAAALEAEVTRARMALLSRDVELDARLDRVALAPDAENALAMGLREAVTNVLRHARARRVEVALRCAASAALLEIADDGRGGRVCPGQGLTGMRERLAVVGGGLAIDSPPGGGTRLRLSVPLSAQAPATAT